MERQRGAAAEGIRLGAGGGRVGVAVRNVGVRVSPGTSSRGRDDGEEATAGESWFDGMQAESAARSTSTKTQDEKNLDKRNPIDRDQTLIVKYPTGTMSKIPNQKLY